MVIPSYAYTDGKDCAKLSSSYGLTPDPWQADILDAWLGRDENDLYTATTCGLSVPRQNGKNAVLEMRELYGLCVIGEKVLHTAHQVKTTRKAFIRLASFFENERQYPELAHMVIQIRKTNGQEAILLNNGGSIEFSARSKNASRGFTVDVVVFDEAQELADEQMEAIMSTMSASPTGNRQLIFTGTPPYPGCPGEVFGRIRAEVHSDDCDPQLSWHEWSVDRIGDIHDRKRWYATNPALGIRLDEQFTEKEMRRLSVDGFARERLGWWASMIGTAIINKGEWAALQTDSSPEGKIAYGIKFSVDGSRVSYSVCVKPQDATPFVELIDTCLLRDGVSWLSDWLIERKNKIAVIVIDGRSHVDTLVSQLIEGGVSRKAIVVCGTKEVIAASTRTLDAIKEKKISHYGQEQLDESATSAQKRNIGHEGGWGWAPIGDADITPIESASLAYWGTMTTKRHPGKGCELA